MMNCRINENGTISNLINANAIAYPITCVRNSTKTCHVSCPFCIRSESKNGCIIRLSFECSSHESMYYVVENKTPNAVLVPEQTEDIYCRGKLIVKGDKKDEVLCEL